jgi:mannitol-1-/sugar-/sorbitol-6-phosphatase
MSGAITLRCTAVLFDLDGVLVDSAACVEHTWRCWAEQHGLDPAHVIAQAHGRRTIETVQRVAPHLSASSEAAALAATESATTEGVFEVPGARELLSQLPQHAWAVVTSGTRAVATLRILHTGLPMPHVLLCAEDLARGKPDPEGYLAAARRLGVEPAECIVMEDAPAGLEAARAAGMRAIGISGTFAPEALVHADYTIERLYALRVVVGDGGALDIHLHPSNAS